MKSTLHYAVQNFHQFLCDQLLSSDLDFPNESRIKMPKCQIWKKQNFKSPKKQFYEGYWAYKTTKGGGVK